MFTGIVEAIGEVKGLDNLGDRGKLKIYVPWQDIKLGESISVDGVCLTATKFNTDTSLVEFDIGVETFALTTLKFLKIGQKVNLERAMKLGERVGGHLLLGHIDGIGEVYSIREVGNNKELWITYPPNLKEMIAPKGSIGINGVSLTINKKEEDRFSVILIPFTLENTTLKYLKEHDKLNIEVDLFARYIYNILKERIKDNEIVGITKEKLKMYGYYNE